MKKGQIGWILSSVLLVASAEANVGIFLSGAQFKALDDTSTISSNALFQLINLGSDGIGNAVVEGSWVGGDDVLIDLPFGSTEFASSGGFDLWETSGEAGELSRSFDFAIIPGVIEVGDLLAIRWWPGYDASDFHTGPTAPLLGDRYGEARVAVAINDPVHNTAWVVPAESGPLAVFDPLISEEIAMLTGLSESPEFDGIAALAVQPIPEPSSLALFAGLSVLMYTIRRRARN